MKVKIQLAKLAIWQPKPYIAECKDSYLSWWFYRKVKNSQCLFERNILGRNWSSFWWFLIKNVYRIDFKKFK